MFLLWEGTSLPSIDTNHLKALSFESPSTTNPTYRVVFHLEYTGSLPVKTWDFTEANAAKLAYKNIVKVLVNLGLAIDCGKPDSVRKTNSSGTMVKIVNI